VLAADLITVWMIAQHMRASRLLGRLLNVSALIYRSTSHE
jgi:hypothetical protein